MNLLLLLSALLSALTGVGVGVRSAAAPQAVAQGVASLQPERAVAPRAVHGPAAARPSWSDATVVATGIAFAIRVGAPAWTLRRRE